MSGKLDMQARLDIEELLAQYCHRVDRNDGEGWAALFTQDGVFEVAATMRLQGKAQLLTMPGTLMEHGGGKWRHQITNILAEIGGTAGTATVSAYGLVTDWRDGGKLVMFTDYRIEITRIEGEWRIANLFTQPV